MPGILSYPMYWTMRSVFQQKQDMNQLQVNNSILMKCYHCILISPLSQTTFFQYQQQFEDVNLLGTFLDNHDNARFLSGTNDYKLYQSALTFTLLSSGVPIIYYGTEQGFDINIFPMLCASQEYYI